eukprot:3379274-Rhodomonas_salina.2
MSWRAGEEDGEEGDGEEFVEGREGRGEVEKVKGRRESRLQSLATQEMRSVGCGMKMMSSFLPFVRLATVGKVGREGHGACEEVRGGQAAESATDGCEEEEGLRAPRDTSVQSSHAINVFK